MDGKGVSGTGVETPYRGWCSVDECIDGLREGPETRRTPDPVKEVGVLGSWSTRSHSRRLLGGKIYTTTQQISHVLSVLNTDRTVSQQGDRDSKRVVKGRL